MKKIILLLLTLTLVFSFTPGVSAEKTSYNPTFSISGNLKSTKKTTDEMVSSLSYQDWEENEPNDSPEEADVLPFDDSMYGNHNVVDDYDVFHLSVPQDGTVHIGIVSNPNNSTVADAVLFNAEGKVEPVKFEETSIGIVYYYRVPKGDYFIVVGEVDGWESDNLEEYDYQLTASFVDTAPPSLPVINRVDDNDTIVTGTAEANAKVYLFKSGTLFRSGNADSNGNYSFNIPLLKVGTGLSVQVKDNSGNKSPIAYTKVKDRTAPTKPVIFTLDDNDTVVKGTAEAGSTVTVYKGTTVIGTNKVSSTGAYSVTMPYQKAGTVINVTAKDAAGYTSVVATTTVLDKTAPKFSKIFPLYAGKTTATGKTEPGTQVVIKRGNTTIGKGWANKNGYFYVSVLPQPKGTKLTYYVRDSSGNTSLGFILYVK